jgi:hypothetical protein
MSLCVFVKTLALNVDLVVVVCYLSILVLQSIAGFGKKLWLICRFQTGEYSWSKRVCVKETPARKPFLAKKLNDGSWFSTK